MKIVDIAFGQCVFLCISSCIHTLLGVVVIFSLLKMLQKVETWVFTLAESCDLAHTCLSKHGRRFDVQVVFEMFSMCNRKEAVHIYK